jgi:hypothetical protein
VAGATTAMYAGNGKSTPIRGNSTKCQQAMQARQTNRTQRQPTTMKQPPRAITPFGDFALILWCGFVSYQLLIFLQHMRQAVR